MKLTTPADIAGLARLILSPECKSVAILSGAGVSVASGIPDFRSPGTSGGNTCRNAIALVILMLTSHFRRNV